MTLEKRAFPFLFGENELRGKRTIGMREHKSDLTHVHASCRKRFGPLDDRVEEVLLIPGIMTGTACRGPRLRGSKDREPGQPGGSRLRNS